MRSLILAAGCCLVLTSRGEISGQDRLPIKVSPETTRVTGPVRSDGTVDFAAHLNQKYSREVTPEKNAAVWYWRAIGPHSSTSQEYRDELVQHLGTNVFAGEGPWILDMGEFGRQKIRAGVISSQEQFNDQWGKATEGPWTEEEYPLVAEWLKANEKPLKLVERGGRQPEYYSPLVRGNPLHSSLLPGIQLHRELSRLLLTRAMLNAGRGDYDAASRDLTSMFHLACQTGRGPTLIEGLVACAITSIAKNALEVIITGTDIDESQLAKLQAELSTLSPAFDIVRTLDEGERFMYLDLIQQASRIETDEFMTILELNSSRIHPMVRFMHWGLLKTDVDWNISLKRINDRMDEVIEIQQLASYAERKQAITQFADRNAELMRKVNSIPFLAVSFIIPESGDERISQLMETNLLPALQQSGEALTRAEVRRRVSPLGCAIERYRRLKGHYPPNLATLVPTYISELPSDPYTDKSFHYRVNADRTEFAVFTFGPNGRDDNGATWGEGGPGVDTDDMGMHSPGWLKAR
jgi:hypothetical protein